MDTKLIWCMLVHDHVPVLKVETVSNWLGLPMFVMVDYGKDWCLNEEIEVERK